LLATLIWIFYLCAVKIIERLKDVAENSGIFLCRKAKYNNRNRVGHWKQPKASLYEPDSAKCGFFYLSKNIEL
jgi:hypothetical protein